MGIYSIYRKVDLITMHLNIYQLIFFSETLLVQCCLGYSIFHKAVPMTSVLLRYLPWTISYESGTNDLPWWGGHCILLKLPLRPRVWNCFQRRSSHH